MIKTSALSYQYEKANPIEFPDFEVKSGEDLLILGRSGIGKSTLLHLLAGLLTPKTGIVEIAGQNLGKLRGNERDNFRGRNLGIVFQQFHFVQSLTLWENLLLTQFLARSEQRKSEIEEGLKKLSLVDQAKKYPKNMSHGQQQRALIAAALLKKPNVILADEPTSSLDDYNCGQVIELLRKQTQDLGATLVVITHDSRLKAQFERRLDL